MTLPMTSVRDKIASSESSNSGLDLSRDGVRSTSGSSGVLSQFKKTKNRMSFLRFPTLPFFRKKNDNSERKSAVGDVTSSCSVSSTSDVNENAPLQIVMPRTVTSFESLMDKQLSRSQPLQCSSLVNSMDTLTSSQQCRSHGNTAQLPPMSVGKATANSATPGGLAARIIDPLKKRRQRVTSVGELPIIVTSSSKEITSITSLADLQPSRDVSRGRRRRNILSSAFTQGSL